MAMAYHCDYADPEVTAWRIFLRDVDDADAKVAVLEWIEMQHYRPVPADIIQAAKAAAEARLFRERAKQRLLPNSEVRVRKNLLELYHAELARLAAEKEAAKK